MEDITLKRVRLSGILMTKNEIFELGIAKDGGRWFKDRKTGTCYRVVEREDQVVVAETRETKKTLREEKSGTKVVVCKICGAERIVAVQDFFQVIRCKECQRKHRNDKRAKRAVQRRAERRAERELTRVESIKTTQEEEE